MRDKITQEQMDQILENHNDNYEILCDLFSIQKTDVLSTNHFTIGTMLQVLEKHTTLIKTQYRTRYEIGWKVEVYFKNHETIEEINDELSDSLWSAVKLLIKQARESKISKKFLDGVCDDFNNEFSYKIKNELGQIFVDMNGGEIKAHQKNVGKYKFLFFFLDKRDVFWNNPDKKDVVDFLVKKYTEQAENEGLVGIILHYENLNNSIFPDNLEELGFSRHEQDNLDEDDARLIINGTPEIFNNHLPRGYFLKEFKENNHPKKLMNIIGWIQEKPEYNTDLDSFREGIMLEKSDNEYALRFKADKNQLIFQLNQSQEFTGNLIELSRINIDLNEDEQTIKEQIDELLENTKK